MSDVFSRVPPSLLNFTEIIKNTPEPEKSASSSTEGNSGNEDVNKDHENVDSFEKLASDAVSAISLAEQTVPQYLQEIVKSAAFLEAANQRKSASIIAQEVVAQLTPVISKLVGEGVSKSANESNRIPLEKLDLSPSVADSLAVASIPVALAGQINSMAEGYRWGGIAADKLGLKNKLLRGLTRFTGMNIGNQITGIGTKAGLIMGGHISEPAAYILGSAGAVAPGVISHRLRNKYLNDLASAGLHGLQKLAGMSRLYPYGSEPTPGGSSYWTAPGVSAESMAQAESSAEARRLAESVVKRNKALVGGALAIAGIGAGKAIHSLYKSKGNIAAQSTPSAEAVNVSVKGPREHASQMASAVMERFEGAIPGIKSNIGSAGQNIKDIAQQVGTHISNNPVGYGLGGLALGGLALGSALSDSSKKKKLAKSANVVSFENIAAIDSALSPLGGALNLIGGITGFAGSVNNLKEGYHWGGIVADRMGLKNKLLRGLSRYGGMTAGQSLGNASGYMGGKAGELLGGMVDPVSVNSFKQTAGKFSELRAKYPEQIILSDISTVLNHPGAVYGRLGTGIGTTAPGLLSRHVRNKYLQSLAEKVDKIEQNIAEKTANLDKEHLAEMAIKGIHLGGIANALKEGYHWGGIAADKLGIKGFPLRALSRWGGMMGAARIIEHPTLGDPLILPIPGMISYGMRKNYLKNLTPVVAENIAEKTASTEQIAKDFIFNIFEQGWESSFKKVASEWETGVEKGSGIDKQAFLDIPGLAYSGYQGLRAADDLNEKKKHNLLVKGLGFLGGTALGSIAGDVGALAGLGLSIPFAAKNPEHALAISAGLGTLGASIGSAIPGIALKKLRSQD